MPNHDKINRIFDEVRLCADTLDDLVQLMDDLDEVEKGILRDHFREEIEIESPCVSTVYQCALDLMD